MTYRPEVLRIAFNAGASGTLTLANHPNSAQFLANGSWNITKSDLSIYRQARLLVRVGVASASANSPRLDLQYSTSFTVTVGSYSQIGTSAVSCSLSATGLIDSGWIDLAAAAKADVFLTVIQNGGDGVEDPVVGQLAAEFR